MCWSPHASLFGCVSLFWVTCGGDLLLVQKKRVAVAAFRGFLLFLIFQNILSRSACRIFMPFCVN